MPIYEYGCQNCNHSFEIHQGVKEPVKKKCPQCKKNKLERLLFPCMGHIDEPRTLGKLAEKNTKMNKSRLDNPEENKRLAKRAVMREYNEINKMSEKQKERYIEG